MRYFGGKQRISKPLSEFLNSQLQENQPFVDLFCGSCNVISKIDDNRLRIANDKHKYLIAMWKGLQNGWVMPDYISEEEYKYVRSNKDKNPILTGFVGFGCSYSGKWFGGYCRDNTGRNYCLNAKNSNNKIINKIKNVNFYSKDYKEVDLPKGSLVYCDIPYKNTTQYCSSEVGSFNHDEFYQWVRDNSDKCDIYVSEYKKNVPYDFKIVWEMESKKDIRNKDNIRENTTEVLMKYDK
ncbi:DNA adenine methylase [Terrisporobacter sp.]|uniref:DNA adenine methylase n=1 Tax=Terrisporobacter sp. TaxID=1965305 RepID=UPI00289C0168|nr:DNA adenine methylase [Terrisporobacter sp.]